MSLSGSFPVTVVMKKRALQSRWQDSAWGVEQVLPGWVAPALPDPATHTVQQLELQLWDDEAEGYFENWAAPAPRVFVSWRIEARVQGDSARAVQASVSYSEGTRMFDSGDPADGVSMPAEVHGWLGQWLQLNYRQAPRKGRSQHVV